MSKRRKGSAQRRPGPRKAPVPVPPHVREAQIVEAAEAELAADIPHVPDPPAGAESSTDDIVETGIDEGQETPDSETVKRLTEDLRKRRIDLASQEYRWQRWLQWSREHDGRKAELENRLAEVAERESAVEEQLAEARDGFRPTLERERLQLRDQLRADAEREVGALREQLEEDRAQLAVERDRLTREIEAAVAKTSDAERRETTARSKEALLDIRIEAEVGQAVKEAAERLRIAELDRDRAERELTLLSDELAAAVNRSDENERLRLRLGAREPEDLLEELRDLRAAAAASEDDGATALNRSEQQQLARLRRERTDLDRQLADLRGEVAQLKTRNESQELALAEAVLRSTVADGYEHVVREYKRHLDELSARVGELRESDGLPFPRCSEVAEKSMASDRRRRQRSRPLDLASFVAALQRALYDDDPQIGLRYDLTDLRLEVAGLAASRLHLLQGPSGTGKTSLPVTMARVLGWGHRIVPVQAGWNDRQDLLGYFNTFENRYQETDFLVALYEAGTPKFSGQPYLIVLDEANLSYMERYFADFLSLLSSPEPEKKLSLTPGPQRGAPPRLDEGFILLPENVWFVATANQDETTVGFAPKTIDRAHVLGLERRPETRLERGTRDEIDFVDVAGLNAAFDVAISGHERLFARVLSDVDAAIRSRLGDFDLSYGNRLQSFGSWFLPVFIATGGEEAEGVDHLLASKVLYRIEGRIGLDRANLKSLEESLLKFWERRYRGLPRRCVSILDRCLQASERGR